MRASTASGGTLTYEARGGRIGLDVLLSVALNHIPESPHVAGVQDVEELVGMGPAVLHVRPEQVVVGTAVPLRKREREHTSISFRLSVLASVNPDTFLNLTLKSKRTVRIWSSPSPQVTNICGSLLNPGSRVFFESYSNIAVVAVTSCCCCSHC